MNRFKDTVGIIIFCIAFFAFFFNLILGFALSIIAYLFISSAEKGEERVKLTNDYDYKRYIEERLSSPTSVVYPIGWQKTSEEFAEEQHKQWLGNCVDQFEEGYRRKQINIFTDKNFFTKEMSELFKYPDKYKKICKFLGRHIFEELVSDWNKSNRDVKKAEATERTYQKEEISKHETKLDEVLDQLISKVESKETRNSIINSMKSNHPLLTFYSENKVWYIRDKGKIVRTYKPK